MARRDQQNQCVFTVDTPGNLVADITAEGGAFRKPSVYRLPVRTGFTPLTPWHSDSFLAPDRKRFRGNGRFGRQPGSGRQRLYGGRPSGRRPGSTGVGSGTEFAGLAVRARGITHALVPGSPLVPAGEATLLGTGHGRSR